MKTFIDFLLEAQSKKPNYSKQYSEKALSARDRQKQYVEAQREKVNKRLEQQQEAERRKEEEEEENQEYIRHVDQLKKDIKKDIEKEYKNRN